MKPKCYKDYLQQEIDRSSGSTKFSQSHINYHKFAKTINRRQMIDRII